MDMAQDVPLASGGFWVDAVNLDDVPLLDITALAALVDGGIPDVSNGQEDSRRAEQSSATTSSQNRRRSKGERRKNELERNRVVQARYRQRQKEKQDLLVMQHEAAEVDLRRQRAEHQQLKYRNSILENVLSVRDSAKEILQEAKVASQRSSRAPTLAPYVSSYASHGGFWASTLPELEDRSSEAVVSAGVQKMHEGNEGSWRELLDGKGGGGGGGGQLLQGGRRGEVRGVEGEGEGVLERWLDAEAAQSLERLEEQLLAVPVEVVSRVKECTVEGYKQNWMEFAGRLRGILARYDATQSPDDLRELGPLLRRRAVFMTLILHHNMECLRDFFVGSSSQHAPPRQQDFWDRLVAAMQINPSQRERHLQLWNDYLRKVSGSRTVCNSALGLIRQASQDSLEGGGGVALIGKASPYLQLLEGAVRLGSFADSEFEALLELLCESGKVFTSLQKARMAAWSYPHFPDILAIVQAIQRFPAA